MKLNKFSEIILSQDLKPTRALQQVLAFFSINPNQPIKTIVEITQEKWIRGSVERWHVAQKTPISSEVRQLFSAIGMINAVYPQSPHYDYILLLGSDYEGTKTRIDFLRTLASNGIQTKQIIALGSDRPLDHHELRANSAIGSTEIEMIQKLFEQTKWENISFIQANGTILSDGTFKRATTADTFHEWLSRNPIPGSCLLISDQPFIGYQNAVAHSLLTTSWHITTVGSAIDNQTTLEDLLDTLARWLYQETN